MSKNTWFASMPVYVTNKTADGEIAYFSLTVWIALLIFFLICLNLLVWGFIGLYEAVRVFV